MKLLALLLLTSCTVDVGQPNIDIQCVEIIFPGEHVLYCDGGVVPVPAARDGGAG